MFSRNGHALSTEFNILHNGNLAFDEGKVDLYQDYRDNYRDILPVEKLELDPEIHFQGKEIEIPQFKKSESKATKAIQRHSMTIDRIERNPQMDEAFLLLGKSRYFTQRFIPAQNAFNYILYHYPNSDILPEAKLWREKTNLRLGNERIAIKNLKKLFRQEILSRETYSQTMATMAQAYINLKYADSAFVCLNTAAKATENNRLKGRYYYILGQLYEMEKDTLNATNIYDKVIRLNYKTNRYHVIHATLNNITLRKCDGDEDILKSIKKLKNAYENRQFLDIINYCEASYHNRHQNITDAKTAYLEAVYNSRDKLLKAHCYEQLAKLCFRKKDYAGASEYYDSVLVYMSKNHKRFFELKKKSDKLKSVVHYESISGKNDSIFTILNLSEKDREDYFLRYIDTLKYRDSIRQLRTVKSFDKKPSGEHSYLYDENLVEKGKLEFQKQWNRHLKKGRNIHDGSASEFNPIKKKIKRDRQIKSGKYDIGYYMAQLPGKDTIDSMRSRTNNAYYQLGIIYNEQFQNFELSELKLKKLIENNPGPQLDLLGKYYLYKLYNTHKKSDDAKAIRDQILKLYPYSQTANILSKNNFKNTVDTTYLQKKYKEVFHLFASNTFEAVISNCNLLQNDYQGSEIALKFEIIKAFAIGRLYGVSTLMSALKTIAETYSYTKESQWIRTYIKNAILPVINRSFTKYHPGDHCKLIFSIYKTDNLTVQTLKKRLERIFYEMSYSHLNLSIDRYDINTVFLTVHGLEDIEKALGFQELIRINSEFRIKQDNFIISSENYELVLLKKNLDHYIYKIDYLLQ